MPTLDPLVDRRQQYAVWAKFHGRNTQFGFSETLEGYPDAVLEDPAVTRVWVLDRRDSFICKRILQK